MLKRLKLAWKILTGKGFLEPSKVIQVCEVADQNKFVQLVPYQDEILALDAQGKIWVIKHDYSGFPIPSHHLLMESPRAY